MLNIQEIRESVSTQGAKLIYQSLDGLNWKQVTFKDISSNIDFIISYIASNKLMDKKVLSMATNCLESFVLESSFCSMGNEMTFANTRNIKNINTNKSYEIVIIDDVEILSTNPKVSELFSSSTEIISINSFQNNSEYNNQVKSMKNIYKIGLLSRKKIECDISDLLKEKKQIEEVEFVNEEGLIKNNPKDFNSILEKYKQSFMEIKDNEFSTSVYLKEDLFSKCINYLFMTYSRKFTNSKSLTEFLDNANEIMPKTLVIDNDNLDNLIKIVEDSNEKISDLVGSKVLKIITFNYSNLKNIKMLQENGLEVVNF